MSEITSGVLDGAQPPPEIKGDKLPPEKPKPTTDPVGTPPAKPPAVADKGKPDAPATVPEKYELKFSDGTEPDPALLESFSQVAKAAGLSNEHAQALVDFHTRMEAERTAAFESWRAKSLEEAQNHPTLGGANFEASKKAANEALIRFDPEGKFARLLIDTGLSNRVEALEMFTLIAKAVGDDRVVGGTVTPPAAPREKYDVLYGNNNKAP